MANVAENLFESLQTGLSERGNTSLRNYETGDVIFYHRIASGVWLEIVHISENYPAWTIQTVNKSKSDITKHIEETFSDPWRMTKNNIGVNCDSFESPLTREEVLEEVDTELYRMKRMTNRKDIRNALNSILKERDWLITVEEADNIMDEYYDTL